MSDQETGQGTQYQPPGFSAAVVLKTEAERLKEEQAEEKRRESRYHKRQLLFNGILTVATVVTAAIASYQGYLLREYTRLTGISADAATKAAKAAEGSLKSGNESFEKTLTEMKRQSSAMKEGGAAAKSSSETAAKTLVANEKAFLAQERPYVNVDEIRLTDPIAKNQRIRFVLKLMNSGKTPALALESFVDPHLGMPHGRHQITKDTLASGDKVIIGASTGREANFSACLEAGAADNINAGKTAFVIWGTVTYSDIFKQNHRSWFCGYWNVKDGAMRFCPEGNDAE